MDNETGEPTQLEVISDATTIVIVPLRLLGTYAAYAITTSGKRILSPTVLQPLPSEKPLPNQMTPPRNSNRTRPAWCFMVEDPRTIEAELKKVNPYVEVYYLDGNAPYMPNSVDELDYGDVDFGDPQFEMDAPDAESPRQLELRRALDLARREEYKFLYSQLGGLRVLANSMAPYAEAKVHRSIGEAAQNILRRRLYLAQQQCEAVFEYLFEVSSPFYVRRNVREGIPAPDELSPQAMLSLVAAAKSILATMGDWNTLAPKRFHDAIGRLRVAVEMGNNALKMYRQFTLGAEAEEPVEGVEGEEKADEAERDQRGAAGAGPDVLQDSSV